jgi:hypothetical protein
VIAVGKQIVGSFLGVFIDREVEATFTAKMLFGFERTTRRYIPENRTLHSVT